MTTNDAISHLLEIQTLNKRTKLARAIKIVLGRVIELDRSLTAKTAMANELTHMHAELSVVHGNSSAEHTKHIETFQKGILEIAQIVWDTSAKSSDRIRRLQEQCVPRSYLDALKGDA